MSDSSRSNQKPIIDIRGISKIYRMEHADVHVLKNINLQIIQGDSVAIMGPSGSGKSTLMHLLGCLDRPTSGSYFFNNQDVSQLDDQKLSALRASHIGFVFQNYNLIPQFSIFENVALPYNYQINPERKDLILQAIERVGLNHRIHHRPNQLSGGESQRVAIARALAINPLLILADEPTGNLDSQTGKEILALFRELNAQGTTLVIVTHDEVIGNQWQRLVKMHDGILTEST